MNNKDLLTISIVTFLTVIVWIVTDAYHAWVASTIPLPLRRAIEPLTPRLDTSIIKAVKERGQVVKAPQYSAPMTTPSPTEQLSTPSSNLPPASPTASVSSFLTPTLTVSSPGASPSGIR